MLKREDTEQKYASNRQAAQTGRRRGRAAWGDPSDLLAVVLGEKKAGGKAETSEKRPAPLSEVHAKV